LGGVAVAAPGIANAETGDAGPATAQWSSHSGWDWNWVWTDDEIDLDANAGGWDGAGGSWYGNGGLDDDWQPELEDRIDIRRLRLDTASFSPNSDAEYDDVEISFSNKQNSSVTVSVVDAGGVTVRTIGTATRRGWVSFVWDGRSDTGGVVPDGLYDVVVGRTGATVTADNSVSVPVAVDSAAPALSVKRPTLREL
jgi:hypothetical protein